MGISIAQFAAKLADAGVTLAFGVTGSGPSFALVQQLRKHGVDYHGTRSEAAAALMAGAAGFGGCARGVSITIKGPGFACAVPGLLANTYEHRPMISVSEAYPVPVAVTKQHKRLDHLALAPQIAVASGSLDMPEPDIDRLIALAGAGDSGTVHFDIAGDPETPPQVAGHGPGAQGQAGLDTLLSRIDRSDRPALLLGTGALPLSGLEALRSVQVPVASTAAAKGVYDETQAFSAGVVTGELGRFAPENTSLSRADLFVGVGLRHDEFVRCQALPSPLVVLDDLSRDAHAGLGADLLHRADDLVQPGAAVFARLNAKPWGGDDVRHRQSQLTAHFGSWAWGPADAFLALRRSMPEETTLIPDTGYHCTVAETIWPAQTPDQFQGSSIARFMGIAIPTAIGRALADRGRPVLCALGEGGLGYHVLELALAVRHKLPIVFAFFCDGRFSSVASNVVSDLENDPAVTFDAAPVLAYMSAMGMAAHRAQSAADVDAALTGWRAEKGPVFLECCFDPEDYANSAKPLR